MNEIDHHQEELEELRLEESRARREHYSMVATAMTASAAVFASLPMAFSQETPVWLTAAVATFGALGGTFAIKETETTQAELKEAKRKVEDYQKRAFITRLRP